MPTVSQSHPNTSANMLWNTLGSVFYQGCLWLLTVLVVRLSDDYLNSGMLAFAMSVGNIYTALGTYMIRTYQVGDISHRYSTANYVATRIVTVIGAYALCAIYALLISPTPVTLLVICAFLLFKADESFVNVLYGRDQTSERLDYVGKSQILRGILIIGVFSTSIVITNSLPTALFLIFIGCLGVTALYDIPRTRALGDSLKPAIPRRKLISLLKECFPSMLGSVIGGLVVASARQYFGIAYGEEALGIYASVATPCVIIQVLAQNLYAPLLLPIAKLNAANRTPEVKRRVISLILLVLGVALALSAMLSLAAEPLLILIYGDSIHPFAHVLPPALAVMTGVALVAVISDLLILFGRMRLTLIVNATAFLIDAALIVPCTALWYMNGINISLIVAYAVASILGIMFLRRPATNSG